MVCGRFCVFRCFWGSLNNVPDQRLLAAGSDIRGGRHKDAQIARKDERIERLEKLVAAFKQAAFGRKSEKTDPDQFDLALEDLETAIATTHAEDEADGPPGNRISKPRATNRGSLPQHLPRVEEVIEPESLVCACGGCLHRIGEDVSERLDVILALVAGHHVETSFTVARANAHGTSRCRSPVELQELPFLFNKVCRVSGQFRKAISQGTEVEVTGHGTKLGLFVEDIRQANK